MLDKSANAPFLTTYRAKTRHEINETPPLDIASGGGLVTKEQLWIFADPDHSYMSSQVRNDWLKQRMYPALR